MYKVYKAGRRYGKNVFATYEDARKYVRRTITKIAGMYHDSIGGSQFSIVKT